MPAAAAIVVLWAMDPAQVRWLPPCPFHYLSGLYCPGCGSGRALHLLLHGDVLGAFRMNPLLMLALPLIALAMLGQSSGKLRMPPRAAMLIPAALIAFWIARNIPVYPLTLLAPH